MNWTRTWHGCSSWAGWLGHIAVPFRWPQVRQLDTPARRQRGYTWVLPGVEGRSPLNRGLAHGLADGGHRGALQIFDWTTGAAALFPWHLRSGRRQARAAAELARQILGYQGEHPGRPVSIVAHSGGAEIALRALETLPDEANVDAVVLLAAAVSPTRDLGGALARCRRGLWNFHSPWDWFFLGLGTLLLGTSDGRHVTAAGRRGFRLPPGADAETSALYAAGLHDMPFRAAMRRSWHCGGHVSWTNRVFAADYLAPLLADSGEPSR